METSADGERLPVDGHALVVDRATAADVGAIVALLADDVLGADRESDDPEPYAAAYARIDADPAHLLAVVRSPADGTGNGADAGSVVGTMQLTLVPGLSRAGATRLLVEGVRVTASLRGSGVGRAMMAWAMDWGRDRGAAMVELTSDAQRVDAHRFYASLGFTASHVGMKRAL